MRQTLLLINFLAAIASCVGVQDQQDVEQLLKAKGPPTFTAGSIGTRGNLLVYENLELFDPEAKDATKNLRGRSLLFCEPWDALWLWAAHSDLTMRRATPSLGLEGPGKKFTEIATSKNEPSKLLKPAKAVAAIVDKTGTVVRTAEITVHELQRKD